MSSQDVKIRFEGHLSRMNCQTFPTGFSSGERGGSGTRVMLSGIPSFADMCQPAWPGTVSRRGATGPSPAANRMGAGSDGGTDLGEMGLHGRGVRIRHREAGADTAFRADGAEQAGPFRSLVVHGAGPGSASGPSPGELVPLPDPGVRQCRSDH